MWVLCNQRKKKKKPRNKSNFLFDNFSYRAESAQRSELASQRKIGAWGDQKGVKDLYSLMGKPRKYCCVRWVWDYHPCPYTQPPIGRKPIWPLLPRMIKSQAHSTHILCSFCFDAQVWSVWKREIKREKEVKWWREAKQERECHGLFFGLRRISNGIGVRRHCFYLKQTRAQFNNNQRAQSNKDHNFTSHLTVFAAFVPKFAFWVS